MALIKSITQPSSVTTDYHRISMIISLAFTQSGGHTELFGESYVSEQARKNGSSPVVGNGRFDCQITATEAAVIQAVLYGAVRRNHMPEAIDHIESDDVQISLFADFDVYQAQVTKEVEEMNDQSESVDGEGGGGETVPASDASEESPVSEDSNP